MYFLVRTIVGKDRAEVMDNEYQGDALVLGGDESAMVHLSIKGQLRVEDGKVSTTDADLSVNGAETRSADIAVGDVLEVPGYRLEVIAPPAGFGFALQLQSVGGALPPYSAGMELSEVAWSLRRSSWIAIALVLLLCLALPLSGVFDDAMWSTGPLASAHETAGIGDKCEACHVTPFVMVEDTACLDCHRDTAEHVALEALAAPFHVGDFTGERCASCHREHNEPAHLVRYDKGQCVDCHGAIDAWPGEVSAATGFTAATHPEFKLALLQPRGPGGAHGWETQRVRRGGESLAEQSNLKFPHDTHLDPEKVRATDTDAALACAGCHTLRDDGEHFEPVTMDNHCRSCHSLSFDIFEPDLELPHGDLRAAIVAMEAHFIREFTDPALRKQRAGKKPRRVPNKREAAGSCEGSGLDCGRAEALKEAEYQFANTGCISCHQVTDTGLEDINDRWYVQPVRITGDWYPYSRFDHSAHMNLALDEPDAEVCETCHGASASSDAVDILVPGRDNCLQCHDESQGNAVASCVSCHDFHQAGATPATTARMGDAR